MDKIKNRIKRFLLSGKNQARVYYLGNLIFEYRKKHYSNHQRFKVDRLGRLIAQK